MKFLGALLLMLVITLVAWAYISPSTVDDSKYILDVINNG